MAIALNRATELPECTFHQFTLLVSIAFSTFKDPLTDSGVNES
jgi:hypothetical protein